MVAHGQVQGVFFRDSTRREAERRGVAGWASNEADGTVAMVFEGSEDGGRGDDRVRSRRTGRSSVSSVDVHEEEPENLAGFHTR